VAARVADNFITARFGVGVFGRDVEVIDNVIRPIANENPFFGVVGINAVNLVCEANRIEPSVVPQAVGIGAGAVAFMSAIVVANIQPAMIVLSGGEGAVVTNNAVYGSQAIFLRALSAENHTRLSVKGNEFQCGPAICVNTDEIVFLDNTVSGLVRISETAGGQVADNRVRASAALKLDGDLDILSATGRWKAADNRADGAVRIIPTSTGGIFWPGLVDVGGGFTIGRWNTLDVIGRLAEDNRVMEIINQPAPPAPGPVVAPEAGPRNAGVASYAITNDGWRNDYSVAMEDFVSAGAGGSLREILGATDIIVIRGRSEGEYHVQCTANWSRELEIGILDTRVRPNSQSVVQVVSNRADDVMAVRRYTRFVMALNIAGQYTAAGSPQLPAVPIEQLNLDI
jgi:hypothetical protein